MSGPDMKRSLDAMSFLGVGLSFMVEVGALGALGWWLDRRLATEPWLLAAGIGIGMVLALTHLLRTAERYEQERRQAKAERDEHDGGE